LVTQLLKFAVTKGTVVTYKHTNSVSVQFRTSPNQSIPVDFKTLVGPVGFKKGRDSCSPRFRFLGALGSSWPSHPGVWLIVMHQN